MAIPKSTLPNDDKEAQDSKYNPGEYSAREKAGNRSSIPGRDDATNDSVSASDASDVREGEERGSVSDKAPWTMAVTNSSKIDKTRLQKAIQFARKRGATFGILGILGIGGAFAASFLGPASMLITLMENFTTSNDSSSTSLERRFMKVLGYATTNDPICANTTKNIKCKMGRISNKSIAQLAKKGIVAIHDDGATNTNKKTGYPSKNPKGYTIDLGDGSTPKNIMAADLPGFLANNPKMAAKVLGVGGAFNLRLKAWSGKYITQALFNKFSIKRDGGLADGSKKTSYKETLSKLRSKIPGLDKLNGVGAGVTKKVESHLGKAKKGGTGYVMAVASCIAVKAPGYIAAGVAAVQLAQIMPVVMDTILSPGSKLKASGVDSSNSLSSGDAAAAGDPLTTQIAGSGSEKLAATVGSSTSFTPEDMEAIGKLLTAQTARASDGKMTSALDSPYLQSAMGINKNKVPVSTDFTPGYSILTSPLVIAANKADKASAPACTAIMSPAAMYTAMAVDAAVTVAASATVVGGVIKFAAGWVLSEVVSEVASNVAGDAAIAAVTDFAKNDKIAQAEGEQLGDVIGISAATFFPAGGMARSIPGLKVGEQLEGFAKLQQEKEDFQRKMDIASLSPFDTTSRYTFIGSIAYNIHMAVFASGSYSGGLLSVLSSAFKSPLLSMAGVNNASAATGFSDASCGYAADFGLVTDDPTDTPAINMAGLPCTGITTEQASMPTATAIELIQSEGWLDETKDIADDASITDMLSSGYIKGDTPLSDYITSCSDASTGDYLFNAAGCTIDTSAGDTSSITGTVNAQTGSCTKDDGCISESGDVGAASTGLKSGQSMAAIPVFLLDYQTSQIINGEDDEEVEADAAIDTGVVDKKSLAQKIVDKNKVTYLGDVRPRLEDIASGAVDGNATPCGINANILKIIDAITDSHSIKISSINRFCTRTLSPTSPHYAGNGSAIDIAVADGVVVRGRDAKSMQLINIAMPIQAAAAASSGGTSRIGQSNCGTAVTLTPGVTTITDYCNHLHLDVPRTSDPTLDYTGKAG